MSAEAVSRTRRRSTAAILVMVALAPAVAMAAGATLEGQVVGVTDGDTLTLLVDGHRQVKVRLTEIDTPERGQPYAEKAKQKLSALVFGREVYVRSSGQDRYGRTLGRVFAGEVDVNAEMVRSGAAWVYRKYAKDPEILEFEREARAAKRGIWALPEAERVPPWEWRARR